MKKSKKERKFTLIAKVGYDPALKQAICVKFRTNNIDNLIKFFQRKYPQLAWVNVYSRIGADKGKMLYTWGSKKGLCQAY